MNVVVLPSPVKLSTLKSDESKDSIVFAIILPQKTSFDVGAVLNTILWLSSIAKPSVKDNAVWFGLCITLLIATCSCVALLIIASSPLLWVNLNFVFVPSNAAFKVCAVPLPTDDKFMLILLFAFDKLVANLIVLWVSKVTKYAVPVVNPPIFPPPPFVYVTLCPCIKRCSTILNVSFAVDTTSVYEPSKVAV